MTRVRAMSTIDEDAEIPFADRWVRVMADYMQDGIWERSGLAGDPADLPVSKALAERIAAWQTRFDREAGMEGFDAAGFAAEGLAVARAVKAELPGWTVVYYDQARAQAQKPGEPFEYEV